MAKPKSRAEVLGTQPYSPKQRTPAEIEHADLRAEIAESPAMRHIVQYLAYAKDLGLDANDPDVIRRAIAAGTRALDDEVYRDGQRLAFSSMMRAKSKELRHPDVVYYMRQGDLIKIGVTGSIRTRFSQLSPQGIMAIEPGSADVEHQRHQQFAHLHSHGEWFRLEDDLGRHIAEVRDRFAAEVGQSVDSWLEERLPKRRARRLDDHS